jgi:prepilin-type N-terminal cleavage/methylation domain-containing protein
MTRTTTSGSDVTRRCRVACIVMPFRFNRDASTDSGEDGFTLVEMTLALALMAIVLIITTPVVSAFYHVNQAVGQTYTNTDQVVLSSEEITQYLHEAVAPCPSDTKETASEGCYTAPFAAATDNSMTFFANTNSSNGPSEVVIAVSGTTLSADVYAATSCPFNGATSTPCAYPTTYHLLSTISNLADTAPFEYLLSQGDSCSTGGGAIASPTSSQVPDIVGVCMNIQTQPQSKAEPTGYQSLSYAFAPDYNGAVG